MCLSVQQILWLIPKDLHRLVRRFVSHPIAQMVRRFGMTHIGLSANNAHTKKVFGDKFAKELGCEKVIFHDEKFTTIDEDRKKAKKGWLYLWGNTVELIPNPNPIREEYEYGMPVTFCSMSACRWLDPWKYLYPYDRDGIPDWARDEYISFSQNDFKK